MTYFSAALTLLAYTDRPLSVGELTALAIDRGLIHPRGRTPDRSMSSVLYRRMAADPDAPITSSAGHFRLRGSVPATAPASALRPAIRSAMHRTNGKRTERGDTPKTSATRRSSLPPAPAIEMPLELSPVISAPPRLSTSSQIVASLSERLQRFLDKHTGDMDRAASWDAERTFGKHVAPLLTILGYRRADRGERSVVRGRVSQLLYASVERPVLLETLRAGHALTDTDARGALSRAVGAGTSWALLTTGLEWRLYSTRLAGALAEPAGALVLRVDVRHVRDDAGRDVATLMWLLTRTAVADGALDGYLAARAIGAALLEALERPNSEVTTAIADAVWARTGLRLPAHTVARQAHLAVRTGRTRDGAPVTGTIQSAAAIATAPEPVRMRDLQRSAS